MCTVVLQAVAFFFTSLMSFVYCCFNDDGDVEVEYKPTISTTHSAIVRPSSYDLNTNYNNNDRVTYMA
jgi:hypothetical protein